MSKQFWAMLSIMTLGWCLAGCASSSNSTEPAPKGAAPEVQQAPPEALPPDLRGAPSGARNEGGN